MTQAKHTPWDFLVNDGAWEVFDTRGHTVACNLTEANARLIAAAPELLQELQDSIDLINQLAPDYTEESVIGKCLARYKLVADKATGA